MFVTKKNIVARRIHDTYFLIDICQNYMEDKCYLYEINEIGYFIWKQLGDTSDIKEVVNELMDYIVDEVEYTEVYEDVNNFLNMLVNEKFLEILYD